MTVNTTDNRVSYTGNGTIPSVPVPFYFLEDADLVVLEVVIATGAQTTKSITTDYTVSGAGDPNGGTVTGVAPLPSTKKWVIYRDPEMTQTVQHVDNDPLSAESIDNPLDKLTMIAQRTRELTERSLRQPDGDTDTIGALPAKVSRASMYLAFDSDGEPIAASAPEGGNVVSAYAATLLDAADEAAARATLGLEIGTDVLAPNGSGSGLSGILLQGRQVIGCWGAEALKESTTNGAAPLAWEESTTNKVMTPYLAFDPGSIEYAQFKFRAPAGLDESAGFTALFIWKENTGASAHVCVWQIEMQAQGDGDTVDSAWGTAVTVTDTGTSGTRRISPETSAITPGGSWAAGDEILVRVSRKATDGSDTLDVDAHLIEVVLLGSYNAGTEPA